MDQKNRKKIAPVIIAVLAILYAGPLVGLAVYAIAAAESQGAGLALPFLLMYALAGGAIIAGIIHALAQRLREIDGGEEDEASKY